MMVNLFSFLPLTCAMFLLLVLVHVDNSIATDSPTAQPVTASPTAKPVTASPTAKPVTGAPTAKPVTGSPTAKPVTVPPVATPTPVPAPAPEPDGDRESFSSEFSFDLFLELESLCDVVETAALLPEVYNELVQQFDDPFDRQMESIQMLSVEVLSGFSIDIRRRELRGYNVRARVVAGGNCQGCPRNSGFTNQVGGRRELQGSSLPTVEQLEDAFSLRVKSTETGNVLDVDFLDEVGSTMATKSNKSRKDFGVAAARTTRTNDPSNKKTKKN